MGLCSGNHLTKEDLQKYHPDFHLQRGERVVYELRTIKLRKISFIMTVILTLITLGIFLLIRHLFKIPQSMDVIVLTNRRVVEWEYRLPKDQNKGITFYRMQSYQISRLEFIQHEYIQTSYWFSCINHKPYTTLRLFFNRFPSVVESYNPSTTLTPILLNQGDVASLAKAGIKAALMQDYVGLATTGLSTVGKMIGRAINAVFPSEREESSLPGHYIEIDTHEDGSFQNVQNFLNHLIALYPYKRLLTAQSNDAAFRLLNVPETDTTPLWSEKDGYVVNLTPTVLPLAPDEKVLDVLYDPIKISFMDWFWCVATLSLYYWLAVRDLKKHKGCLVLTDCRVISVFVHSEKGKVADEKYLQYTKSWFISGIGASMCYDTRTSIPFLSCIIEPERHLAVDIGGGTLTIRPNNKNPHERIYGFFQRLLSVPGTVQMLPPAADAQQLLGENDLPLDPYLLLPGESEVTRCTQESIHNCAFTCMRVLTCGLNPPHIQETTIITTHRICRRIVVKNACADTYWRSEFWCHLNGMTGTQFTHYIPPKGCFAGCCGIPDWVTMRLAYGRHEDWTITTTYNRMTFETPAMDRLKKTFAFLQILNEERTWTQLGRADQLQIEVPASVVIPVVGIAPQVEIMVAPS
eukprot:TRINITY_DN1036_c0_g1_i1.p1 TRINITY_DN1036_c0_g1~~TRINITY_DN1036_c0_g1_i1.p1  ORF type:complete len:634 (-),score=134.44 TRINITY_DN1036_c0_g1_i1:260-2161(-)